MAFFDKVKEAGLKGKEKAKDLADLAKLKMDKASAEKSMKDIYTEMGKSLFSEHADLLGQLFPEQLEKLNGFKDQIAGLEEKIAALGEKGKEAAEAVEEAVEEQ